MKTAKILVFPFAKVRLEPQSYQAVILQMPKKDCPIAMLPAVMMAEWINIWPGVPK